MDLLKKPCTAYDNNYIIVRTKRVHAKKSQCGGECLIVNIVRETFNLLGGFSGVVTIVSLFFTVKNKKEISRKAGICIIIVTLALEVAVYTVPVYLVNKLSEVSESVGKGMTVDHAIEAVGSDIFKLRDENAELLAQNNELQTKNEELQNTIDSLQKEVGTSDRIGRAESYAATGNYEISIPILNAIANKSEEVVRLLKEYTAIYEASVVKNSEDLANEGCFDEAVALIDDALQIIPESQTLQAKKNGLTPRYLVDTIECYKSENAWMLDSQDYIKMTGQSYRHAIYSAPSDVYTTMFNNSYTATAYYNLEKKYHQLTGTVGHIDFSGNGTIGNNDAGRVYSAEITIWGDDDALKTITLAADDPAVEFNVPITGVKVLEFRIKCSGNSKVGIADIRIR